MSDETHSRLIKGATADWEVVVGLEVHAQVTSRAKLFSGASTAFGGEPNTHVSLVDAAMPGMRGAGGPHRARPEGEDQSPFLVRPQELLLSGPAAGLSDIAVQEPDRRRGRDSGRPHPRPFDPRGDRAPASRAGRRQAAARPVADDEFCLSQ